MKTITVNEDGSFAEPIPEGALRTVNNGSTLTVYEDGDELPVIEAPPLFDVPAEVTARQFKVALIRAGLWDAVTAAVNAADVETQVTWHAAQSFERGNSMLAAMAAGLSYTDEQVDDVFRLAATL